MAPFELGVLHEVFGIDRSDDGVPAFDYQVCAEHPRTRFPVAGGMHVTARRGLAACAQADLIALPSGPIDHPPSAAVLSAVRAAVDRGAYVLAVCTAAFTVAAAGVLDGRPCATHWRYAPQLQHRFPDVLVNPDALYLQAGSVVTSAGTAAGIDACLHLIRTELGPAIAGRIARRMVVAPHRDGGQRQFLERPLLPAASSSLAGLLEWLDEHLADQHTLQSMARRATLSPRTLLRRFHAETGGTPYAWLTSRRVARAQELLEGGALSMEAIARHVGLGSATLLRHHFRAHVGVSPLQYRRQFHIRPDA
ncbi:helix-turn-helix domain-containing protein [Dactylosporangium sp. CA-092794]|uniref:helix-turn-helix domain-containing protein n=1 Tax=Dactylosporangium sp. CA-092794 TaxID=3239929 RepID=UPI003D8C19BB